VNSSWKHETEGENEDNVHVSKKNRERELVWEGETKSIYLRCHPVRTSLEREH
jgi:hypothetical protein